MPEATEDIITAKGSGNPRGYACLQHDYYKESNAEQGFSRNPQKNTYHQNIPEESAKAVRESLEYIIDSLEHGIEILTGEASDCARK